MNPFESNGSTYMRTASMRERITNNEKYKQQKEKKKELKKRETPRIHQQKEKE